MSFRNEADARLRPSYEGYPHVFQFLFPNGERRNDIMLQVYKENYY
jgi:hypothetical protein